MPTTTCVELCEDPSVEQLNHAIARVLESGANSLLLLGCESDAWTSERVDPALREVRVPLFGGIFPSIIHQGRLLDRGTLVVGLAEAVDIAIVNDLSARGEGMDAEVRRQCGMIARSQSFITLVDGLAKHIEHFVESFYGLVGPGRDIVGCGAGSLDFVERPCLLTKQGLIADAAVVVGLPFPLWRGVQHGWETLDGPYLVTGSRGHLLETLNYQPAFDVYRERVEAASGLCFRDHDFFAISKTYPLGIERLDGELLVRDPIRVDERGGLVCVGDVPENSMVYILKGHADRLVDSACTAAIEARGGFTAREPSGQASALVFDCISRVFFLDDTFPRELDAIQRGLGPLRHAVGCLTLGEIANTRNGPINLLNKSTVIGVF